MLCRGAILVFPVFLITFLLEIPVSFLNLLDLSAMVAYIYINVIQMEFDVAQTSFYVDCLLWQFKIVQSNSSFLDCPCLTTNFLC